MFKKIEIWILYLVLIFVFISYIIFGALVVREHDGGDYLPIISPVSKIAHFISLIPRNLNKIRNSEVNPRVSKENRFNGQSGFSGNPNENETYLLISRYDGDLLDGVVELVNLETFDIIHTWNPDLDIFWGKVNQNKGGEFEYLTRDKNDERSVLVHPLLTSNGSLISQNYSPLFKIDKESNLEWMIDDEIHHHSIEEDHEGNYWVAVDYYPFKIDKKFVGESVDNFLDDGIRKISSEGEILFDKSIPALFIENGLEYILFANGKHTWNEDPIHINDIEPVSFDSKYWKKGDLFLSLRHPSMIVLYRPSSNQIIYKINGPFFNQHDVDILNDREISIFDNNLKHSFKGRFVDGHNRVVIYNFEKNNFAFYHNDALKNEDVRTISAGRSQILPNGDLFIEENNYGRLLYFNSDGSLRWSYVNRGKDNRTSELGWSRILYDKNDIANINSFLNTN